MRPFAALSAAVGAPLLHGAPALTAPAATPSAVAVAGFAAGDGLAPTTAGPRRGGLEPADARAGH